MTDSLPTLWPAEPHTLAKHAILGNYLKAWMAILSQHFGRQHNKPSHISYVDGFAGPGEYEGGELGSPVIAIKTSMEHSHDFPIPVNFLFVENDPDRAQHLRNVLACLSDKARSSSNIDHRLSLTHVLNYHFSL